MKVFDVAIKDLQRVFRSPFTLVMMFGAPLLIAGLLYFAFGSLTTGTGSFTLPKTRVAAVNLDQPAPAGGFKAGEMLLSFLQSKELTDVLQITIMADEVSARSAVDQQQADVALIIPRNFTQAAITPGQRTEVTLYQDPTLTIGPGIVKDLVNHYMDGFSGASIAAQVAMGEVPGGQNDAALAESAMRSYAAYIQSSDHDAALRVSAPAGTATQQNAGASIIGPVMAGMLVFFVFFMGANGAQSIIREQEEGTLARLFTTPVPRSAILGGKYLGVLITLVLQTIVLLAASALIFRIAWGQPLTLLISTLCLIVAATGFGVMVMSFIKDTRQTGPVLGGVLTLTGMLGGLFSSAIPNLPAAMDTVALSMPQGWAMRALKLSLAGSGPGAVIVPGLVLAVLGAIFFLVGLTMFRRRFA